MDLITSRDVDFEVDLESGVIFSDNNGSTESHNLGIQNQSEMLIPMDYGVFIDKSVKGEDAVGFCCNVSDSNGVTVEKIFSFVTNKNLEGEKTEGNAQSKMDKPKKSSNKKASKPPRPPKGPSLDAADQKLIREIAKVAMLKRARVERMKALKKSKAAKASSSSSSNLLAIFFTVVFCLVIISQGMSSSRSHESSKQSPVPAGTTGDGFVTVQYLGNPSASESNSELNRPGSGPQKYVIFKNPSTSEAPNEPGFVAVY